MQALIILFSFFLPSQIGYHFKNLSQSVWGFEVDYLVPTVYLTDILAILIIVSGVKYVKVTNRLLMVFFWLLVFAFFNIFSSVFITASAYKWLRIFELLVFALVIKTYKKLDVYKQVFMPLSFSVVLVCVLGLVQTLTGHSQGEIFYWLGERTFNITTPGISTFTIFGREYLRSYSTFSHPNSLAGFLLVFLILLFGYKKKIKAVYYYSLELLIMITLYTTFSLNILVAMVVLSLLAFIKVSKAYLLIGLLLVSLSTAFLTQIKSPELNYRVTLVRSSLSVFAARPLTGVGLNNFIPVSAKNSQAIRNSWELQPVHNIYLLTLSEAGIVGLFAFGLTLYVSLVAYSLPLMAVLLTGLWDHYWLTLQQNILLLILILTLNFGKLKTWRSNNK